MRKRVASYQASTRRLLTSLLIFLLFVAFAPNNVVGARRRPSCIVPHRHIHNAINPTGNREHSATSFTAVHSLISKCSERPIQMNYRKSIDARGSMMDAQKEERTTKVHFEFSSDRYGTIFIRSNRIGMKHLYLCFSKRGKLISRRGTRNGKMGKKKKLICGFREISWQDGFRYQSTYNPDWFIGANKNGKLLKGDRWMKPKKIKKNRKSSASQSYGGSSEKHPHRHSALQILCEPSKCYTFMKWPRHYTDTSSNVKIIKISDNR